MLLVIEKLHNLQYTLALLQYIMQLQVQLRKQNEWKKDMKGRTLTATRTFSSGMMIKLQLLLQLFSNCSQKYHFINQNKPVHCWSFTEQPYLFLSC